MSVQREVARLVGAAGYETIMIDYDFNVGAAVEKNGKRHAVRGPDARYDKENARKFWDRPAETIAYEMIAALRAWEPHHPHPR